jgi:hypothetical protein
MLYLVRYAAVLDRIPVFVPHPAHDPQPQSLEDELLSTLPPGSPGKNRATEEQEITPHLRNDSMGKKTVLRMLLESWKSPFLVRPRPQKVKGEQCKPRNTPMPLRMPAAAIWTFPSLETRVAQIKGGRPEKKLTLLLTSSALLPKTSAPLRLCRILTSPCPL